MDSGVSLVDSALQVTQAGDEARRENDSGSTNLQVCSLQDAVDVTMPADFPPVDAGTINQNDSTLLPLFDQAVDKFGGRKDGAVPVLHLFNTRGEKVEHGDGPLRREDLLTGRLVLYWYSGGTVLTQIEEMAEGIRNGQFDSGSMPVGVEIQPWGKLALEFHINFLVEEGVIQVHCGCPWRSSAEVPMEQHDLTLNVKITFLHTGVVTPVLRHDFRTASICRFAGPYHFVDHVNDSSDTLDLRLEVYRT